jgi:hypothetical protein
MTNHDHRHRHMDAARVRAELTVPDLWLRYVALGGTADAFDLDGYLQGLVSLEIFQQDVLAQALNEALEECYRANRVPLSTRPSDGVDDDDRLSGTEDDDRLRSLVEQLLRGRIRAHRPDAEPPGGSFS